VGAAVSSIAEFRGGHEVGVVRVEEAFDIDLSLVNFDNDVLVLFEGDAVTRQEVLRTVCMLLGANEIDQFTTYALAQQIKDELAAAGHQLVGADVSDDEVLKQFEETKKMAPQMMQISGDEWEKQIRDVFGWDRYVEFQKVQLNFEKIFLPDPPAGFLEAQAANPPPEPETDPNAPPAVPPQPPVPEADLSFLPPTTFELLDERFHQYVKDTYARGQEIHALLRMGIIADIKRNLMRRTVVRFYPDVDVPGSPDDQSSGADEILFTVNGSPIRTAEIYTLIQHRADPAVWRMALREVLTYRAVDRRLAKEGHQLASEEAERAFQEMAEEYDKSIIPLAQAVRLRGFYSVHHYRRYFDRKSAYRKMLTASLTEEDLRKHFDQGGRLFFEHGTVGGHVLFVPASSPGEGRPIVEGALSKVAEGVSFADVVREHGAFPNNKQVNNGSMSPQVRLQLRNALGESEYIAFVTGYSIADEVFYRGTESEVVGPIYRDFSPQLTGWFAFQVGQYFNPGRRRAFEETRESVKEDLADLTFPRYASQALAACNIELPPS
jgi:hypothetical protein